ncbi:MAG: HAD-IC family P-type ATPase, partial [Acidimicrobiales bacterium]
MTPGDAATGLLRRSGRARRRAWAQAGRAHIEVRAVHRSGAEARRVRAAVEGALRATPGVRWAEVNAVVGRVAVSFDGDAVDLEDLVGVIEAVEEAHQVHRERFPLERPEHPGDVEPIVRALVAGGADVVGLGLGLFGRVLRSSPVPIELAGLVGILEAEPRVRRLLETHVGTPATDVGLALANAVAQGLAQGPVGLLVDICHRATVAAEVHARRRSWEARHDELCPPPGVGGVPMDAPVRLPRSRPRPNGPVDTYADRAAMASFAGFAAALAATRDPRRAAAAMLAGVPKAARLGREGFAAQLGRALAGRGVMVIDRTALRRLDAVDCLCLEAELLVTPRRVLERVTILSGDDHREIERRIRSLYDPAQPLAVHRRGQWVLGPVDGLPLGSPAGTDPSKDHPGRRPKQADREEPHPTTEVAQLAARRLRRDVGGSPVLGLSRNGRLVAVSTAVVELDPLATTIVEMARGHDLMVAIAGSDLALVSRLGADLLVDGGAGLPGSVRTLQEDGCSTALVARGDPEALVAADCSLEVPGSGGRATLAGHLVTARGLEDACFLVEAIGAAHESSRQAAAIALAGAGVASVLALVGPPRLAAGRAMTTVNLASLVSLANGTRAAVALTRRPARHHQPAPPWHELDEAEVLDVLETSREGLSEAQVRRRAALAAEPDDRPPLLWRSVLEELANPLTPVLAAGAAASAAVGGLADAGLVGGVAGVNALIGGFQRYQAERAIRSLARSSSNLVRVRRGGGLRTVEAGAVVPGDVVELEAGDTVPADCRILQDHQLEVDESSVTGESLPVAKSARPSFASVIAERTSMLYEGTSIAAGSVSAVVVATGADTEAGRSDLLAGDGPGPGGGVEHRLARLNALILPAVATAGGAVIAASLLRGRSLEQGIGAAVSLAVAAVPEGLPVLTTMAQLAPARRLSTRGALVRDPRAIEALGRVDVLCTDKTGTLTEGRIRLQRISDGCDDVSVRGPLKDRHRRLLAAGLRASPVAADGQRLPHATDRAVVSGVGQANVYEAEACPGWQRGAELPFEPSRGYHATLGRAGEEAWLSVKGAPETVLPRCSHWAHPDGRRPIAGATLRGLHAEIDRLARQGLRILAVAEARIDAGGGPSGGGPSGGGPSGGGPSGGGPSGGGPSGGGPSGGGPGGSGGPSADPTGAVEDDEVRDLCLLGFLLLTDPVRATAASAVQSLHRAGVEVVMVTGDHPSTAEGIAVELGILNGHRILTGAELAQLDDVGLDTVLADVSVFARVTPADKVRIVAAFQRAGRSVAMTGDGANDAPAIRMADVGVALGARSTPAARGAADLVVTDERIETILDAIVEGRAMWRSVRDALAILLGGNLGEVAFVVGSSVISGQAALSARQLLLVNLLTDVAPALAIAVRTPTDRDPEALMREGPDASLGRALERDILLRATATAGGASAAWLLARVTGTRRRASTTALVALVGAQLGQTLATGARDRLVALAGVGSAAVLLALVQTPGPSQFFGCTPLDPLALLIAGGAATGATGAAVIGQWALRRPHQGRSGRPTSTSAGVNQPVGLLVAGEPSRGEERDGEHDNP